MDQRSVDKFGFTAMETGTKELTCFTKPQLTRFQKALVRGATKVVNHAEPSDVLEDAPAKAKTTRQKIRNLQVQRVTWSSLERSDATVA